MVVDGKDFGEEIGGVNSVREEDKAEKVLTHPLLQPVEAHVYRLGFLRAYRGSRKTDSAFVINKKKGRGLLGVAAVCWTSATSWVTAIILLIDWDDTLNL